jgi:hypothetical protein
VAASHPATISRRALLGGAGLVLAIPALSVVASACGDPGADGESDPLRALGESLLGGPDGPRLAAAGLPVAVAPIVDEPSLFAALDRLDATVRAELAAGRTVLGDGWLLADSEAVAVVAYARA